MPRPQTIDEILTELERLLAETRRDESRIGYFTALYHKVTIQVRDGIAAGEFDDGPRMEALDVHFAKRYLAALAAYRGGEVTTQSWELVFRASDDWMPLVVQHLLVAMNAHINLDLGIATALAARGSDIEGLRADFDRVNGLLTSLVDEVKDELAQIWKPLALLDRISGTIEDVTVEFSMTKARDAAWTLAVELAGQSEAEQAQTIARRDRWVASFGRGILHPPIGRLALLLIRLGERRDIAENIKILS